jgi:hypothetical protein
MNYMSRGLYATSSGPRVRPDQLFQRSAVRLDRIGSRPTSCMHKTFSKPTFFEIDLAQLRGTRRCECSGFERLNFGGIVEGVCVNVDRLAREFKQSLPTVRVSPGDLNSVRHA